MSVCGVGQVGYSQNNCYKSIHSAPSVTGAPSVCASKINITKITADVVSFTGKNILPVKIRNARLADIPAIMQLDRLCFPEHVLQHSHDRAYLEKTISKDASSRAVAIDEKGKIIGYCYVQKNYIDRFGVRLEGLYLKHADPVVELALQSMHMPRKELWLGTMAVHPDVQGQKVGQQLMLEVFDMAAQQKAEAIGLGVETDNKAAQALYRKFGFVQLKRRRDYYGEGKHIYLMGVDINTPEMVDKLEQLRKEVGLNSMD